MQDSLWTVRQNNSRRDGGKGARRTSQAESVTGARSKTGGGAHQVLVPRLIKSLRLNSGELAHVSYGNN